MIILNDILHTIDTADLNSYVTASISPTSNRLILAVVANRIAVGVAGGPQPPAISGLGLTWTLVISQLGSGSTPNRRVSCWRALGTVTPGTLTISFSGETQTQCAYHILECTGVDTSGGEAAAIVQSHGSNDAGVLGSTGTTTLDVAPSSIDNLTVAACVVTSNLSITAGAGFTILAQDADGTDGTALAIQSALNKQTSTYTWTGNHSWYALAVELLALPPGGSDSLPVQATDAVRPVTVTLAIAESG